MQVPDDDLRRRNGLKPISMIISYYNHPLRLWKVVWLRWICSPVASWYLKTISHNIKRITADGKRISNFITLRLQKQDEKKGKTSCYFQFKITRRTQFDNFYATWRIIPRCKLVIQRRAESRRFSADSRHPPSKDANNAIREGHLRRAAATLPVVDSAKVKLSRG